ncbi:MAG TPA: HEAT repeat domain-containing protein, partial [Bryobacteraceae bacterium]|nr:HEAT repeat domain-containing protein [Bryobacteraceae bacterium]
MKFFSHAVLLGALAAPAFCQAPPPEPALAEPALAPAPPDQLAAADAQVKALADSGVLSEDKMAELKAKLAEAAERMKSVDMDEIQSEAQDKLREAQDRLNDELNFRLENQDFDLDWKLQEKLSDLDMKLGRMKFDFATPGDMAFLQQPKLAPAPPAPMPPMPPKAIRFMTDRGDRDYDAGTRALDQHRYDEAVIRFDQVITSKSSRADGALYWKAYALNRAGKKDESLATLQQLRRDYPQSAWLNDAQALETEVKQSSGQPISPAQESNDDLKLLAINSLMNADPERAVPLIENILKGNSPPNVKRNALFVLTQSRSPRAQQLLRDYAKGGGNPDLQLQAIRYLGQTGSRDSQQQLGGIYGAVTDARVKATIIDSLSGTRAWDSLLNIAKTEKDPALRNQAIRSLVSNRNAPLDGLLELYASLDISAKTAIVDGLRGRRDAKTLVDLARKESDPQMKRKIVE